MKLSIPLFAGLILLGSCSENSKNQVEDKVLEAVGVTETKNKALGEVLKFYGGQAKYAVVKSASTSEGVRDKIKVTLFKGPQLEKYPQMQPFTPSNVAYIFYKNLKEEQKDYDAIETVLISSNGKRDSLSFTISTLDQFDKKVGLINKIVSHLKNKDFDAIKPFLNNKEVYVYEKDVHISNLKFSESKFKNITIGFNLLGFSSKQTEEGKNVLIIAGNIIREDNTSTEFSAEMDPNSNKQEVYRINYYF